MEQCFRLAKHYYCSKSVKFYSKLKNQSSLYSRYYAEAYSERRDPSPRLSAWTTQKHRSGGDTVSDLTGPVIEPSFYRTESDVLNLPTGRFSSILIPCRTSSAKFLPSVELFLHISRSFEIPRILLSAQKVFELFLLFTI